MLEAKPQNRNPNPINPRLIALTPRQVLLANPKMGKSLTSNSNSKDCKSILHHSIAQYLQHYGFCKTLKKFRSEAHLQEDYQKGVILDLEEICIKYLDTINVLADAKGVEQACMNGKDEGEVGSKLEIPSKKKKKRPNGIGDAAVDNSEPAEKLTTHDVGMENGEDPGKVKSKEKKKNKKLLDSVNLEDSKQSGNDTIKLEDSKKNKMKLSKKSAVVYESQNEAVGEQAKASETKDVAPSDVDKKSKDKKKKKPKELDQEDNAKTLDEIPEHGEEKSVKKRKRAEVNEDHSMLGDKSGSDESKRRKTDSMEEEKSSKQRVKVSGNSDESNGQGGHASLNEPLQTPSKQLDSPENGKSENEEKTATQRSSKKQHKGSAEPTTVRAFQRIKFEEVEYADEKLKDNSYWAKDGANSGYGAKAQEVLGQVRGRGFRHEKTKKKRGSYRGGQIDLQSHSVKFNYSDDEE